QIGGGGVELGAADLGEQRFLAAEVGIHRALGEPGGPRDLSHRGAGVPAFEEGLASGTEQIGPYLGTAGPWPWCGGDRGGGGSGGHRTPSHIDTIGIEYPRYGDVKSGSSAYSEEGEGPQGFGEDRRPGCWSAVLRRWAYQQR